MLTMLGFIGVLTSVPIAPAGADVPPGFAMDTVISGLDTPTGMEFAADGSIFVTEKRGRVLRFDSINDQTPTIVADRRTQTHNSADRGMLGLAIHPDFPAVPWIYVSYTLDQAPGGGPIPTYGSVGGNSDPCPNGGTTGCPAQSRVVRFNGTRANAPETVLFQGHCQQFNNHTVGDLEFDGDGNLLASFGDGSTGSFVEYGQRQNLCGDPDGPVGTNLDRPTTEGGQARSQDILTRNDPTGVHGSVLRVNPGNFSAISSNPLGNDNEANAARMIATGLRNPFRMEVDSQTGRIYVGNVGGAGADEINVIQPNDDELFNSGWPCYEGPGTTRNTFWLTVNICQQLINSGDHDAPMFSYGRNQAIAPGESCPNGGLAVSGLALNRSGFGPQSLDGALFFSDFTRNCIWYLPAGGNGQPNPNNPTLFATEVGAIVDLEFGPDGNLYAVDIAQDRILQFTETGGNSAPVARFSATPAAGAPPLAVNFNASASSDPDGDQLTYAWDFDGNGTTDATGRTTSHTYTQSGSYEARLRVTDQGGLTNTTTRTISVGEGDIAIVVVEPADGRTFKVGATVPARATATYADGRSVPSSAFSWDFDLVHCVPNAPDSCHQHDQATINGSRGTFVMPDHEFPSFVEATLTVNPPDAAAVTTTLEIDYRVVDIDVTTQPAGLEVLVGSASQDGPFTRPVARAATTNASVTATQTVGGTTYEFVEWRLNGNRLSTDRFVEFSTEADADLVAVYRTAGGGNDTQRPSTPRGLSTTDTQNGVRLNWTQSTDNVGVTTYVIYRSTNGTLGNQYATSTSTTWTDNNVNAGTTYTYAVRARDAAGNLSWRSNLSSERYR